MALDVNSTVDTVKVSISSDVGQSGTFSLDYPAGRTAANYGKDEDHTITAPSLTSLSSARGEISVEFGASNITVTVLAPITLPQGSIAFVNLNVAGVDVSGDDLADPVMMTRANIIDIFFGAPIASDSDGVAESQACTASSGLATGINGALAADGAATMDVARCVTATWTGTAILTVTGTDAYGEVLVESSASGSSMTGKKAFKTVTDIATSADITALSVGTSKVLGLPAFIGCDDDVLVARENADGATVGTLTIGDTAAATATTGDVRGTYSPNGNPDGSRTFSITALMRSVSYLGVDQFNG
jgi:hypothetical protein